MLMLHMDIVQDAKNKKYSLNGILWFLISTWKFSIFLIILITSKVSVLSCLFKLIAIFHSPSFDLRPPCVTGKLLCITDDSN